MAVLHRFYSTDIHLSLSFNYTLPPKIYNQEVSSRANRFFYLCQSQVLIIINVFDLILYIPVNNFSVMLGWVFLGWTSTKQGLMCLPQKHNTVTQVRLEPATSRSQDKHSTTELLGSLKVGIVRLSRLIWSSGPCLSKLHVLTHLLVLRLLPNFTACIVSILFQQEF